MADENKQRAHLVELLKKMENSLARIYGSAYKDVLKLAEVRRAIEDGGDFTWKGHPEAARQLEAKLAALARQTEQLVKNGTSAAWDIAHTEGANVSFGGAIGKADKAVLDNTIHKATESARKRGATAERFNNDRHGGLTISGRVWKNTRQSKEELEAIIQSEIAQGHSADQAVMNVRKYLLQPNEVPKFVKGPDGKYIPNSAWNDYKPGTGVYRSAYQNARRLAVTEVNMAYRQAEIESYRSNPLVVGYEVKTSGNHIDAGGREICECLAGKYPKTFMFTGWHPQCRCYIKPITCTRDEFREYQQAIKDGNEAEWRPKSLIDKTPDNLNEWIAINKDRIEMSTNLPFFIRDNYKIGRDANGELKLTLNSEIEQLKETVEEQKRRSILEKAKERHEKRTEKDKQEIIVRWDQRKEILTFDRLENPLKVARETSYETAKEINKNVERTLSSMPAELSARKAKLEFEIEWMKNEGAKRYPDTYRYAIGAYKKELAIVDRAIELKAVKDSVTNAVQFAETYSKSEKLKTLIAEFETAASDKSTDIKLLKRKADAINKKYQEEQKKVQAWINLQSLAAGALNYANNTSDKQYIKLAKEVEKMLASRSGKIENAKQKVNELISAYRELYAKEVGSDGSIVTAEEVIAKMGDKTPKTLLELPKAMNEYKFVNPDLKKREKEVNARMKELFDNNDYGMDIEPRFLESVYENGFLNTFQTGTSNGYEGSRKTSGKIEEKHKRLYMSHKMYNPSNEKYLKKISAFETQYTGPQLQRNEYEKYGHLLDRDKYKSITENITQYGDVQVRFKKDKVVCTWTFDDSLRTSKPEYFQPSLTTDPQIVSFDKRLSDFDPDKNYDWDSVSTFQNQALTSYIELQYHGDLTIDMVESMTFKTNPSKLISKELIAKLKAKGIELWYVDGGKVILY